MSQRPFTAEEKYRCAEREVRQRKHVYPRRVAGGHMTQRLADEQIAIMEAIRDDYEALAQKERLL